MEKAGSLPTDKYRADRKHFRHDLALAVIFGLMIGVFANATVSYSLGIWNQKLGLLVIGGLLFTLVVGYLIFYFYVFEPNHRINEDVDVLIVYDTAAAEIIEDIFDGYYPQQMAWQTFARFKEKQPQIAENRIKDLRGDRKHILTELVEYITILALTGELLGFGEDKLKPDKTEDLPPQLEKNTFVSFLRSLEPQDPVDLCMQHLQFDLPEDINIRYESPLPVKHGAPDPNTFGIRLEGKHIKVHLTGGPLHSLRIPSMTSGPAPVFEGVRIRPYWQSKIVGKLPHLRRALFPIRISAELKFWYILGLRRNWAYLDWAFKWIRRFAQGKILTGLDWKDFRERKEEYILSDIYDTIREIKTLLDDHRSAR